jgi:uncharacterized membrane protein
MITVIYSIIMCILWFFKTSQLSTAIKIFIEIIGIIGVILFILSIFYLNGIIVNASKDEELLKKAKEKIEKQIKDI